MATLSAGALACSHTPLPSRTHLPALLVVGQIAVAWEASCSELLAWVGVFRALWGGAAGSLNHRRQWGTAAEFKARGLTWMPVGMS